MNINLKEGQSAYEVIEEYIKRYWSKYGYNTGPVIVSVGVSNDGKSYELHNEVADAMDCGIDSDIIFLYDWWEGQRYIKLFGIKAVSELEVSGGIYE